MLMKNFKLLFIAVFLFSGVFVQGEIVASSTDSASVGQTSDAAAVQSAKDEVIPPVQDAAASTEQKAAIHPAKNEKPAMVPRGADGRPLPDVNGKLTLEDCIQIALANSPKAVSAQLNLQNAHVNLNLAKSEFFPTVSAGASQGYNNGKTDGSSRTDHGASDVYAQAEISISGISDMVRNVKTQKLAVEQAELNLDSVKNDIIRTVKKNYYALLSAVRAVGIRTQSRDLYKDQYERSAEYFRLGLRPKVDVTTAEVNLNNEELSLIRAKNLVKTASAQLANSLGVTTPKILDIEDIVSFEKFDMPFDQAVQTAYANRPDVLSAQTDVRISQIKLNQAKAGFFPTFSFSAGFSKNGDDFSLDNEETKLLAAIEIPIFSAFKTYNGVKQAKISLENTLNSNRSLLNDVFLEVQSAYINMQEASESIPIAELNVEKAKENLDLSRGRYNEGIGDIIELKDAEVAYTDAELSLLTARYDYASAVADLKQAMGTN